MAVAIRSCVLLSLLGFGCALEKEQDFAASADLLGVTIDLSDPSLSKVCVGNKVRRLMRSFEEAH